MKNYLEACKVPVVEIGAAHVPRLIMGLHPYDGISYVDREKDATNWERFTEVRNVVEVLRYAVEEGGIPIAQTDHMIPHLDRLHLVAIWKCMEETGIQIQTIPFLVVPLTLRGEKLDGDRVNATFDHYDLEAEGSAYREHFRSDPIIQYLTDAGEAMVTSETVAPYTVEEMAHVEVDYGELEQYIGFFDGFDILMADPGAEVDLLAMTGRFDLIREYLAFLKDRFSTVISSIHHAGVTIPLLEREQIDFDAYLTTINKPGVFMLPTPDLAVRAIREASKPVIAIKPQAGGRFLGQKAFDYVFNEIGAAACMFGMGTVEETGETIAEAKKALGVT